MILPLEAHTPQIVHCLVEGYEALQDAPEAGFFGSDEVPELIGQDLVDHCEF